jgi:ABC-2 type transport system ATP-binding protein
MSTPLVDVRNLRKRYGTTVALAGATCHVAEGELFGLLGPNGAGKTTLLSILSGLLTADSGDVLLLGKPLRTNDRDARRMLGIVPQELAVYNDLTARENLRFLGELYGMRGEPLQKRAAEVLSIIRLSDRGDDRVSTFSGGMKRRLNLGAALMHSPRLLLLDEPTVGVDPQSRNLIFEEVRRLNAAGTTVIYTSHYMEEVQALCTRIGIMDSGRVIACDTVPNLLRLKDGSVRFRVAGPAPGLRPALDALPDCHVAEADVPETLPDAIRDDPARIRSASGSAAPTAPSGRVRLACLDVKGTLLRLGVIFHDSGIQPLNLEADESNLESVFLHLTGRALRD